MACRGRGYTGRAARGRGLVGRGYVGRATRAWYSGAWLAGAGSSGAWLRRGMATENTGGRAGPTPACGLKMRMLDPT